MKATRRLLAVSAAACLVAASCGDDDDDAGGEALEELGEGEGAVSIIAWAGYIERGETDPAYDWVTQFEQDTGCAVSVKTAATSDEMVTLMTGSMAFAVGLHGALMKLTQGAVSAATTRF